jgi:hypothetical protein
LVPFRFSDRNFVWISHLFHACCMSHCPWFDHPNNVWWNMEVMKLLIMQTSPAFSTTSFSGLYIHFNILFSSILYYLILGFVYSLQHPVLQYSLCPYLMWETSFHTHTKQQLKL